MNSQLLRRAIFLMLPFLLSGCFFGKGPGVSYHDPMMDFSSIHKVAVLPFTNLTHDEKGAARVRDTFSTMLLASSPLYVIPEGEVARGISLVNMPDPSQPTPKEIKRMCAIIGADAVIGGVLREYGELRSGSVSAPVISLSLEMYDAKSGIVVWTGSTTRGGITMTDRLFGGGGQPMDKVTREAVQDLLDRLFG